MNGFLESRSKNPAGCPSPSGVVKTTFPEISISTGNASLKKKLSSSRKSSITSTL